MVSILSSIWRSAGKALQGQEKLSIVFWLWGVLLYVGSFIIGGVVFFNEDVAVSWLGVLAGWLGIILVFIYPLMFCFSLWRCAKNTNRRWCGYMAKIYALAFIPAIHIWLSWFVLMASVALLGAARQ